jgi:hypothetical protein
MFHDGDVMGRISDRRNMPLDARVAWLESDVDTVEADLVRELKTVRSEVAQRAESVREEVNSLKRWAVTLVVTLIGVMGGLFANLLR